MQNSLNQNERNNINSLCEKYNIRGYTINTDQSINVDGDVDLFAQELTQLPLKFGVVSGNFDCGSNKLTSLEGCPRHVGGNFDCQNNLLTTLAHNPESIGGNFNCNDNQISSLEYCPESIGGNFFCCNNELPVHFDKLINELHKEETQIFIKYQNDMSIWDDNTYNEAEAQLVVNDIKDGLL